VPLKAAPDKILTYFKLNMTQFNESYHQPILIY